MTTYGSISEFQHNSEDLATYLERVELYFSANDIPDAKQVPIFRNVVASATYGLLRSLLAPVNPKDKSLAELMQTLKSHFEPKRNIIAEWFRFHRWNQMAGESVAQFVAELRHIASRCEFGEYLTEALRDRLVCGLRSEPAQRKLLGEGGDLTLERAIEIAQMMESAKEQAQSLHGLSELAVGLGDKRRIEPSAVSKTCYRCGKPGHLPAGCRFREAKCHKCGTKGHLAWVYRGGRKRTEGGRVKKMHKVEAGDAEGVDAQSLIAMVHTLSGRASKPYKAVVRVNGEPLEMEIDTGEAVSLISKETLDFLLPAAKLSKPSLALHTYTSEPIPVLGEVSVRVDHNGYSGMHKLVVVKGKGPTLLGRNWLSTMRLDWASICNVATGKSLPTPDQLTSEYQELFQAGAGTLKRFKAHLSLREGARPRFWRPRTVPFAIKARVGEELDRLEESGILQGRSCRMGCSNRTSA